MADRLTQLQDSLDQLLTQMFASITYIDTRHPSLSILGQVDQHTATAPPTYNNANAQQQLPSSESNSNVQRPPLPTDGDPTNRHFPEQPLKFQDTLRELAQDLVVKQAQIEALIEALPGLGQSRADQEARIEELERELGEIEKERVEAGRERNELLRRVEGRILGARRP
jgi:mediator of RNA polymerase II transcription subunit 21